MNAVASLADVFQVPPATRFVDHAHEGLHLCAVLAGGFVETVGRDRAVAAPGILRLSPSTRHDIHFGPEGARCLLVEVGPEDAVALRRPPRASAFLADAWLAGLARRLESALSRPDQRSAGQDLVLEILAQVTRREEGRHACPPPAWLLQCRDRLADEWRTPPSAQVLALAAGVHRVHLVRSFRDHFGCTLGEYVRRRRLAQASRLLTSTDLPLSRIAAEAGFADQAHLTRALKHATGATPLALRRARPHQSGLLPFNTRRAVVR
jgi:AraC family transcriptional regulator